MAPSFPKYPVSVLLFSIKKSIFFTNKIQQKISTLPSSLKTYFFCKILLIRWFLICSNLTRKFSPVSYTFTVVYCYLVLLFVAKKGDHFLNNCLVQGLVDGFICSVQTFDDYILKYAFYIIFLLSYLIFHL